jgi:predicted DNA-binding transcriptional regulator AlpA
MPGQRKNGTKKPHRSAAIAATPILDPALFAGTVLDGYLTPRQLAAQLGCYEKTLSRWHAARSGPPRVTIGRRLLYRRTAVADWLQRQEKNFDELDLKGIGSRGTRPRRACR